MNKPSSQGNLTGGGMAPSYPLSGSLVIDPGGRDELILLNAQGRAVWQCLEAGLGFERACERMERDWGVPAASFRDELRTLVDIWGRKGLLDPHPGRQPAGTECETAATRAEPPRFLESERRVLYLCGVPISVAISSPELEECVMARLGYSVVEGVPGRHDLGLRTVKGRHFLFEADRLKMRSRSAEEVFAAFVRRCAELINPGRSWLAVLHAGATMSPEGRSVVYPGGNGRGKSSLVRTLLSRGHGYFSDDCVPISEACEVVPVPFAICLKKGGWFTEDGDPDGLGALPSRLNNLGVVCKYMPPRNLRAKPSKLDGIVFPNFDRGARPQIEELSPEEALAEIVISRAWISRKPSQLREFLAMLERVPAHRISYSTSEQAVSLLADLGVA